MALAQARELVHDSQMGVTYGIMETVSAVIFILTPPLAGVLFEYDPTIVYPISIGLLFVSIAITYFFSPRKVTSAPSAVVRAASSKDGDGGTA